jgi:polyisoprenoid-binding protein YceI
MQLKRPIKLVLGGVVALVVLVVLVVGGTWLYINVIEGDPPDRLTLEATSDDPTSTTSAGASSAGAVDGAWTVGSGSVAGYRVKEVLFGQSTEAVGRTTDVTGSVTIGGTAVSAAKVTVDLTTVSSDQSRRDGQFHGRIMNTAAFPTAIFTLIEPADFGSVPTDETVLTVEAIGKLRLHGKTKTVTVQLQAKKTATGIEVAGNIPVVFADYDIPNPTFGPAQTDDHGEIEFLLLLTR